MKHHYKIGLLATCQRHYLHVGKTTSNLMNIERSGAPCFLIPIQMTRLTYKEIGRGERTETEKDRLTSKAGTSENSQGKNLDYSGSLIWRIVIDLVISKLEKSVITSRDGGKIIEKAKAGSNIPDTAGHHFPDTQRTPKPGGQNSTMLSMTYTRRFWDINTGGALYQR